MLRNLVSKHFKVVHCSTMDVPRQFVKASDCSVMKRTNQRMFMNLA